MPGPCPQGQTTSEAHKAARCQDKERCTGPGCRLRRPKRERRTETTETAG